MTGTSHDALLQQYAEGYEAVVDALQAVDNETLDRRPAPGEWSARQVVHHLADSETMSAIRLRRLLTEDNPVIEGYDENAWAARLHYEARPVAASLELLRTVRAASAELLSHLAPEDWERAGTHTESGPYSVQTWLETYARHPHDHADQIRRAAGGDQ
jgi:hypothetical protein